MKRRLEIQSASLYIVSKLVMCFILFCIFVYGTLGCGSAKEEGVTDEYKYGKLQIQALGGGACNAPAYIAYEKGFFKEEGLNAELVSGTLEENKTGLATGQYVVTNGDFQWFPSIQQGMDLKVIGGLHKGCIKIVVPPDSEIKSIKDLEGKNIGIDEIGGTPMAVTSVALSTEGIDSEKGVVWKTYPLDQLTEAVKKGEIDAYAAWDPYGVLAEKNDNYKVLLDIGTDPLFAGKSCCFLYASGNKIAENPEKVKAIARAYKKACDWIKENPKDAAQIEIDKGYVATDNVDLISQLLASYDYEFTTDEAEEDVKYFADKLKNTGFIKSDTDSDKFTKDTYYNVLGN